MIKFIWEDNTNYKKNSKIKVLDIIELHTKNRPFTYMIRVLVTAVNNEQVSGEILGLFDHERDAQIIDDAARALKGQVIQFSANQVQVVHSQ